MAIFGVLVRRLTFTDLSGLASIIDSSHSESVNLAALFEHKLFRAKIWKSNSTLPDQKANLKFK